MCSTSKSLVEISIVVLADVATITSVFADRVEGGVPTLDSTLLGKQQINTIPDEGGHRNSTLSGDTPQCPDLGFVKLDLGTDHYIMLAT